MIREWCIKPANINQWKWIWQNKVFLEENNISKCQNARNTSKACQVNKQFYVDPFHYQEGISLQKIIKKNELKLCITGPLYWESTGDH